MKKMFCVYISDWLSFCKGSIICGTTTTIFLGLIYLIGLKLLKCANSDSAVDRNMLNSLHRAILAGDAITTFKLIQKCPKAINIPHQADGYSPFMRACLHGKTQLVRIMLNCGADVSLKTPKGETPIYLTVFHHVKNPHIKDATCIHALYYAGSDINASNHKGYAPLQLASMFGHTQLVIWLLNKGARSFSYPDPYVLARLQGHYETAMIIKRRRLPALQDVSESREKPKSRNKKKGGLQDN